MFAARLETARRKAGSAVLHATLTGLTRSLRVLPKYQPHRWGVRIDRDVPYGGAGQPPQALDVYRPVEHDGRPLPVVLYVHGGGFRILSKDSHWIFGYRFAQAGYLVFNIDYRLARHYPYPAGLHDVLAAWLWVREHAAEWGGDPDHIVVAGESAGGNLVTSLTLACCDRFDDPWAERVFAHGAVPKATLPACPMVQVTELDRFDSEPPQPTWIRDRIHEVATGYTRGTEADIDQTLASPLLALESGRILARELPPFFVPCGDRDPIVADSTGLAAALDARGVPHRLTLYPGQGHAFHALGGAESRACWRDTFAFLDQHAPRPE